MYSNSFLRYQTSEPTSLDFASEVEAEAEVGVAIVLEGDAAALGGVYSKGMMCTLIIFLLYV